MDAPSVPKKCTQQFQGLLFKKLLSEQKNRIHRIIGELLIQSVQKLQKS